MSTDPKDQGCKSCDLGQFDGMACRAKKYEKQAEVMTTAAAKLAEYRKQLGESRTQFAEAWEKVAVEREGIAAQLAELKDVLDCRLTPEQKECLDQAAGEVFADVDECLPTPGCCTGNCEFHDTVAEGDDVAALTARIQQYRADVAANMTCFEALVGEAKVLTDTVDAIKKEVTALATDVQNAGDKAKVPRWYVRRLIASRGLEQARMGHGFASVAAYTACLCTTLECIATGWAAIAVLEGALAELACIDAAKRAECERKAGSVLESILEAYECCLEEIPPQPEPGHEPPYEQGHPTQAV